MSNENWDAAVEAFWPVYMLRDELTEYEELADLVEAIDETAKMLALEPSPDEESPTEEETARTFAEKWPDFTEEGKKRLRRLLGDD